MRPKILIISFIISIPIWLGINILTNSLEGFWYELELAKRPELFVADINENILERNLAQLKSDRELKKRFDDLDINARAAISIEVSKNNKKILLSQNLEDRLPIASLTKLMTALVIFDLDETYSFSQLIPITNKAVAQEGSSKYRDLVVGEKLSVKKLIYTMLIESSNDAAFALTEPMGSEAFVGLMNLYADDIGLENTYFVNPTGLEPDNPEEVKNYSTVEDFVKLTEHILKEYPDIFEITVDKNLVNRNTNKLLLEYSEIIGGKTGWTSAAGGCLLVILDDPDSNKYYINIVLGAKDRFAEMRKIIETIQM